jgi:thiol-disulfide isomerase/thioredoxin
MLLSNTPGTLFAQKYVKIGDQVPEVTLSNVLNYKSKTLKLSDFKGKVLILDFWATWCGSCIEAMPKLDSLQNRFDDRIQILSVTYQTKAEIDAFKKRNQTVRDFKLPLVTGDDKLKKLFPHRALPHLVWISPKGKFLLTSSGYNVTNSTLQDILKTSSR